MNFAPTRHALHGNPQLLSPLSTHHQNTRPPKPKDSLPPNRFSKQTPTVLFSFPSNTMTFGECTRKLKPHSGPPRRLTSRPTLQIEITSLTMNATSSPTFLPSLLHQRALSTRTSAAILRRKSHRLKPDASTASKSPSRIFTAKPTHSSLTHTSRTMQQKNTYFERSRLYRASNEKHIELLNGATLLPPALPNA